MLEHVKMDVNLNDIKLNQETLNYREPEIIVRPKIGQYQLLGDSIFVRFASSVMRQSSQFIDGTSYIGFCVSGQRIDQLRRRIKKNEYTLSKKVLVLIGTNDILCGRSLPLMVRHFNKLLQLLKSKNVSKIVILTLPPIPRLALLRSHWQSVLRFNEFLRSLRDPENNVIVIDIFGLFVKEDFHNSDFFSKSEIPKELSTPTKRKATVDTYAESPMKLAKLRKSVDDEANDETSSPFARYLNRVNREEIRRDAESSDDEGPTNQMKPFIEYAFWHSIKRHLNPGYWTNCQRNTTPSPTTPITPRTVTRDSSKSPSVCEMSPTSPSQLSDLHKKIIEYTDSFLRLDYFEILFPGSQRMDMIHPNSTGLKTIWGLLVENDIFG